MRANGAIQPHTTSRPRVLVIGAVPPGGGGVALVDHVLLTCSLRDKYDMLLLDTSRPEAANDKENTLAIVNFYYYFSQLARLLWLLIFRRPRIVHQAVTTRIAFYKEISFLLVARLFGTKTVAHIHGSILDVEIGNMGPRRRCLMSAAFSVPDCILVLSEYWRTLLKQKVSHSLEIRVVPNSIDASVAEAIGKPARQEGVACLVISLGRLGHRKGLFDAFRAASLVRAQYPQIRFAFAGPLEPGMTAEKVQQAAAAEEVQDIVMFPGLISGKEKLDFLGMAQILILPSYHENFPISILEGMAVGLPIVATAIAGIPEIVEEGRNGYLIRPGDAQALADRILLLAKDPSLRQRIGQANQERVYREYHPDVFAARIANIYQELIGA